MEARLIALNNATWLHFPKGLDNSKCISVTFQGKRGDFQVCHDDPTGE
jgi:hypothetical protein